MDSKGELPVVSLVTKAAKKCGSFFGKRLEVKEEKVDKKTPSLTLETFSKSV